MQSEKLSAYQQRIAVWKKQLAASFDVVFREIEIEDRACCLIFLSSLSDGELIADVVESIVDTVKNRSFIYYPGSVSACMDDQQAMTFLLSGQCVVIVDGEAPYYVIETRAYPSRSTAEPSVEKSIRAAHDGFVENIIINVGLLRRRIRDPRLRVILNKEGVKTKTDIAYVYIDGLVDVDLLADFQNRLQNLDEIEIVSERMLCESLYGKTLNPYPHVRYSERPDICAIHLLQGYLVVIVDNAPSAMIIPTTFFELNKQMEEYTQTAVIAVFTRTLRLFGVLLSIYFIPLWMVLMKTQNHTLLNLHLMEDVNIYGFGLQVLLADIAVEWIRQALIHTPDMLSSIMGFIAVFLLGDMAIGLGAYTEEILLVVALCNIGNLLTPNYELSLANKFFRIVLALFALVFGLPGFCFGIVFHVSVLLSTKTIKFPYLYPLCPFSWRALKRIWLGAPIRLRQDKQNETSNEH